jgi:predicted nucleotidyltransferase
MNQQIFKEIQALKRQILPDEKVILFGSQARGDAHEDSDWDLLVVLNKKGKQNGDDFGNYAYPFTEIGWDYGVAINPLIYTQEEWDKGVIFPFYKNVMKEGCEIKVRKGKRYNC